MKILKSSPIIKTRMTLPFRVVLRFDEYKKEYVVHVQSFMKNDNNKMTSSYHWGDYTREKDTANRLFQEKCDRHYTGLTVENFMDKEIFEVLEYLHQK